jgi:hypothetical protein
MNQEHQAVGKSEERVQFFELEIVSKLPDK